MYSIKTKTLAKICIGSGFLCTGVALYMIQKTSNVYQDSKFFQEAMKIAESHAGVKVLLGLPITASKVYPLPPEEGSPIAEFSARLKGSKDNGYMYLWAEKKEVNDGVKICINRIEIQADSDNTKRLVVKS